MGKRTKEDRKKVAYANMAIRDKLSPEEQLKRLDERLGKGVGAKKERERLKGARSRSHKGKPNHDIHKVSR